MVESLAGFVLSFLAKLLLGWLEQRQKSASDQEIGRLRSERDHALEALRRQDEMAAIATRPAGRTDTLSRLEEGSA